VATGGDRQLGGVDWDRRLVELLLDRFQPGGGNPRDDYEAMGELELKAEAAKLALTKKSTFGISFVANRHRVQFDLTRDNFEKLTDDLVLRTLDYTELVIDAAAERGVDHIDDVILVGGMSKMPIIAERLQRRFPNLPSPRPPPNPGRFRSASPLDLQMARKLALDCLEKRYQDDARGLQLDHDALTADGTWTLVFSSRKYT